MKCLIRLLVVAGLVLSAPGSSLAGSPPLHVQTFGTPGINVADIVWAGQQFLYVENTTNAIFAGDAKGGRLHAFAKLPKLVEETRCVVSPGGHGFPPGQIYCHIPDNRIFRLSPDGRTVRLFATLPAKATSDGMLAFDTVGGFGYRLVAATGRTGTAGADGGSVYTIDGGGTVRPVGSYNGPGGADEIAVAPARFGSIAGWALLTVDPKASGGTIVAMSPTGRTRTIARLPDGPNPIAAVSSESGSSNASRGWYVAGGPLRQVYFIAASELAPYTGAVLVGTEVKASFWVVRPRGRGFVTRKVETDLPPGTYNLEGADYVR